LPWLDDLRVTLYPGNETSRSIFVTGLYEPNEFFLLSKILKPGMTFVDVGANMGLYTLYAARRVGPAGRVLAIEPSTREIAILENNIRLNALTNVRVRTDPLSDEVAEVELLVAQAQYSGHNTLGAFGYSTQLDHREKAQSNLLDDVVTAEGLSRIDVVKIDIEGSELKALRGATGTIQRHHPLLLLELSDRALQHQNANSSDVLSLLAQFGYKVYTFDTQTGLPTPLASKSSFDSENIIAVAGDSVPW
jgi:FkbM family methyltransferase